LNTRLITPLSASLDLSFGAHPNLACQLDPVYDFGRTSFDRSSSKVLARRPVNGKKYRILRRFVPTT
jgi:hypothetical protein